MILVDVNLLVYAHVAGMSQHAAARSWLDERLSGRARVGLPWPSLLAFIRLVSNPRLFPQPESVADAWHQVEQWLGTAPVWIPLPTERHTEIIAQIFRETKGGTKMVSDAHLVALAIEHGLTLCSTDSDFARFPGLRWENPLARHR